MLRCVEIRLAGGKIDDIDAFRAQLAALAAIAKVTRV